MIGLSSILNIKKLLHSCKHAVALKAQSHLTSLLDLPEQVMVMLDKLQCM